MRRALDFPTCVTDVAQDLRVVMRRTRRAPALAAAITLTIGLGLGVAAAIFMASAATLIDPLPYARADRLVHLWEVRAGTDERSPTSYPTLLDWRSRTRSVSALEGYDPTNITVGLGDEARMLRGAQVTARFFQVLGIRMSAGRDFLSGEDASGPPVAIVSQRFAQFIGGAALDHTVTINGTPHIIVGVLPTSFHFALLQNADIFVPLAADEQRRADRSERSINVVGRLKDDARLTDARAEFSAMMSELASENPAALAGRTVVAVPLRDALLGSMKPILTGLLVSVAILLAAMCANLALLMLTRYLERTPELAMRSALGATRARVLRQLLVESLAPAMTGAALALAIGQMTTRALLAAIPDGVRIGMPYLANVGLDGRAVALVVILAAVLAITFGLGPALHVTKGSGRASGARTTLARGDRRLRRALVTAQVALAVVLLVSSGLFVTSFSKLIRRDVGFRDPESIVTARVPLEGPRYHEPAAQRRFYEALLARSTALPGVRDGSLIDEVPGGGGGITTFESVDHPRPRSMQPRSAVRIIGGEYFRTMGIPVVAGRGLESRDRSDALPVAVISASAAKLLGANGTGAVVGRKVRLAATGQTEWEVVGVVGDVQAAALDAESPPVIYLSHLQAPENRLTLVLRTRIGVAAVAAGVRTIGKTLDAGVPVYAVSTLHEQMSSSKAVFSRRFPMILCGVFAAAALALTLVALYAVSMHEVSTRRREFGIRLALGGSPRSIRRLILDDAIRLGVAGVGIGGVVAMVASRSMHALLYGVPATDWRVYTVVAAGVLVAAVLVTLVPALRASSMHPSVAMRAD